MERSPLGAGVDITVLSTRAGGASHGAGTAVAVAVAVAGVGVHHGGAAVLVVAQPLLDGAEVVAAFELAGRDGVADSNRT